MESKPKRYNNCKKIEAEEGKKNRVGSSSLKGEKGKRAEKRVNGEHQKREREP